MTVFGRSRVVPLCILCAALPAAGLPATSPAVIPPPASKATGVGETALPRAGFLAAINAERARAGVKALAPSPALDAVAQSRAEEIARTGKLPSEEESFRLFAQVQRRIAQAGYRAHGWTESITVAAGEVPAVVAYWKTDASYRDAMGADYRDVGVGVSRLDGVPLYTFLFAWPEKEFYARQTAKLADLPAVRASMLAAVNAERRAAGRPLLTADRRLDVAAQRHAEDMLARSFYAHLNPEGHSALERAQAAGYPSRRVGENIAEGEFSVEEVMDGWMKSSGHRENVLDAGFDHLGVGLAVGRFEDRLRILWVQDFGLPAQAPTVELLPN